MIILFWYVSLSPLYSMDIGVMCKMMLVKSRMLYEIPLDIYLKLIVLTIHDSVFKQASLSPKRNSLAYTMGKPKGRYQLPLYVGLFSLCTSTSFLEKLFPGSKEDGYNHLYVYTFTPCNSWSFSYCECVYSKLFVRTLINHAWVMHLSLE